MPDETPYSLIGLHVSPALLRILYDALYTAYQNRELSDKERKEVKFFVNYLKRRYGEVLRVAAEAIN